MSFINTVHFSHSLVTLIRVSEGYSVLDAPKQSIKLSFIGENVSFWPSDTDAGGIYNKNEANIRVN